MTKRWISAQNLTDPEPRPLLTRKYSKISQGIWLRKHLEKARKKQTVMMSYLVRTYQNFAFKKEMTRVQTNISTLVFFKKRCFWLFVSLGKKKEIQTSRPRCELLAWVLGILHKEEPLRRRKKSNGCYSCKLSMESDFQLRGLLSGRLDGWDRRLSCHQLVCNLATLCSLPSPKFHFPNRSPDKVHQDLVFNVKNLEKESWMVIF